MPTVERSLENGNSFAGLIYHRGPDPYPHPNDEPTGPGTATVDSDGNIVVTFPPQHQNRN